MDPIYPKMLRVAKLVLYQATMMLYATNQMRQYTDQNPTDLITRMRLIVQQAAEYAGNKEDVRPILAYLMTPLTIRYGVDN